MPLLTLEELDQLELIDEQNKAYPYKWIMYHHSFEHSLRLNGYCILGTRLACPLPQKP